MVSFYTCQLDFLKILILIYNKNTTYHLERFFITKTPNSLSNLEKEISWGYHAPQSQKQGGTGPRTDSGEKKDRLFSVNGIEKTGQLHVKE